MQVNKSEVRVSPGVFLPFNENRPAQCGHLIIARVSKHIPIKIFFFLLLSLWLRVCVWWQCFLPFLHQLLEHIADPEHVRCPQVDGCSTGYRQRAPTPSLQDMKVILSFFLQESTESLEHRVQIQLSNINVY